MNVVEEWRAVYSFWFPPALVHRVIQVIHKGIGICNIAPWLGDWGHGTTNLCGVERG